MPTISESFDHALPTGVRSESDASPDAHVSGPSTQNAEPPGFAIKVSYQDIWNTYANSVLSNVDLTGSRLASWENTRRLLAEADVSDASSPQLINSVDLALDARHPRVVITLNQRAINSARTDKCWFRYTSGGPISFAVLDYKRPGVIRNTEIEAALVKQEHYDQHVAAVQRDGSYFGGNSFILLKQAVNYANQYNTKYVAFFDWETLFLIFLDDQEGTSGGMWCCATVIRDRKKMRRALLGFLERAYQASVAGGEQCLPPLLPPSSAGGSKSGKGRARR